MNKTILAIIGTLAMASAASAQTSRYEPTRHGWDGTYTPGIDATRAEQRAKIEEGRGNDQLTRREYDRLLAEQDRIAAMERRAKADGIATPHERRQIREAQHDAERHIYQETHNNETRWNRWHRRWWYGQY
jgi:hypothetical protein